MDFIETKRYPHKLKLAQTKAGHISTNLAIHNKEHRGVSAASSEPLLQRGASAEQNFAPFEDVVQGCGISFKKSSFVFLVFEAPFSFP